MSTHGAEDRDRCRFVWPQDAGSGGQPYLLAIVRRQLEPDFVDLELLFTTAVDDQRRGRNGVTVSRLTQGSRLFTSATAVMPSSSDGRAPLLAFNETENVGKATAAKSEPENYEESVRSTNQIDRGKNAVNVPFVNALESLCTSSINLVARATLCAARSVESSNSSSRLQVWVPVATPARTRARVDKSCSRGMSSEACSSADRRCKYASMLDQRCSVYWPESCERSFCAAALRCRSLFAGALTCQYSFLKTQDDFTPHWSRAARHACSLAAHLRRFVNWYA